MGQRKGNFQGERRFARHSLGKSNMVCGCGFSTTDPQAWYDHKQQQHKK